MKKNLTRILAIVLTIVMTITAVPLTGFEAKADDLYQYGNYYYYPEGTQFISSIRYGQDETSADATAEATQDNHTKLDVDLNSGVSGSDYIYLGYKTSTNINDAMATYFRNGHDTGGVETTTFDVNGKTLSFTATGLNTSGMKDLNATAKGDYIYLFATKDPQAGLPVTAIAASASGDSATQAPGGYYTVEKDNIGTASDCNAGAGGDYVYIYFDNTSAYTDVTKEVIELKERIEIAEDLEQSDYTADSWANYNSTLLDTAKNHIAVYESNEWNAGYITPQELKNACKALDNALSLLVPKNYQRTVNTKAQWNLAMSQATKSNQTWDITLGSDILIKNSVGGKLAAVPAGATINLNMNNHKIMWEYGIDNNNFDFNITATSYTSGTYKDGEYWGLITNNGTLNISGSGKIGVNIYQITRQKQDRDNVVQRQATIVNNGTMTLGENIIIDSYRSHVHNSEDTWASASYSDVFLYNAAIYNENGILNTSADINVGSMAGTSQTGKASGYAYSFVYGIYGGTVNANGGYIDVQAMSGGLMETGNSRNAHMVANAIGIFSDNSVITGNTTINVLANNWEYQDQNSNTWDNGADLLFAAGLLYTGENYPVVGPSVNIDASFYHIGDVESQVILPGTTDITYSWSGVFSDGDAGTISHYASAITGVSKVQNAIGMHTSEMNYLSGSFFGETLPYYSAKSTAYKAQIANNSDYSNIVNAIAVHNSTNDHETQTSFIANGVPGSSDVGEVAPYCATAAVEYARRYALSYNKEWFFYVEGGDCANFVSQALYAGGYQMTADWHCYDGNYSTTSKIYIYRTDEDGGSTHHEWIRAEELRNYLVSTGGKQIHNPSPGDFSLGDAVFYDWNADGEMDHSAIVTAIDNGTPKVSCHSTPEGDSKLDYHWTLDKPSSCCYLIKLKSNTCNNDKANSYKYYLVNTSSEIKSGINSGSTIGTIYKDRTVRVISENNGWGYINYLGKWGWINLSNCTYKGSWNKINVSHSMSGWYTHSLPTCISEGLMLNVCSKCGYTERKRIPTINHKIVAATCVSDSYCTMCSSIFDPALGHNWDSGTVVTAPTCINAGTLKHSCTRCSATKTSVLPTTEHSWSEYVRTAQPTCTKTGTDTKTCSVCKRTETKSVEKLGHNMQTITVNSTCLVEGTTTSRCTRCNYTEYSDTTAALGHDYVATVTVATCTENGYTTYKCSRCNDTYTDSVAQWSALTDTFVENAPADKIQEENGQYRYIQEAWDHDFAVTDSADATCTEDGYVNRECSRCKLENTEIIPAFGHDWGEWTDNTDGTHSRICARDESHVETLEHVLYNGTMTVAPTCETEGTMEYTCEICGGISTETIEPIGHNYYLDEDMSVASTCAEDGYDYYVCANNPEHNYKEVLAATGHNMSEQTDLAPETGCGEGKKVSECTKDDCDYYEEEYYFLEHSYGEKIEVPGNCNIESYSYIECEKCHGSLMFAGELDPDNHADYETVVTDAIAPTCTEDGYTGDTSCVECGGIIEEGEVIPALTHDMSDWSTNNDVTHTKECQRENCDYTETENCTFSEWLTIKEATCTEKGSKERKCTECGYIETADIAPTDHAWDDGVIDPSSTCKDHGTKTYTCQNDNSHKYTEEVPLDENNHVGETYIKDAKDPDCTNDGYTGDTYCSDCDKLLEQGETISALTHDMGEWYTVTEATCTEKGLEKRECQRVNCDYSEERETAIDPDNHYEETFYTVDEKADCANDGKKSHHCERCDESLDEVVISKREHAYDNGVVTTAPTCTEGGIKTYTCTNAETEEYKACAHSYTEVVPATDHDWGEWNTVTSATCTEDGLEKRVCKNDASHVEENVLPAIDHDWDDGVIDPSSTCNTHGIKTYTCQNDASHTYTEEVPLDENNHEGETYIKDNKDATCTENGYTGDTYCSDCNVKLSDGEPIPATGHDWGEWNTATSVTCTEDGLEKRVCKNNASHVEENVLAAIGHDWDDGVIDPSSTCNTHGIKTYTCQNDASHTYTEEVPLDENNHVGETYIKDNKDATCTENGYTGDTYCSDCNVKLSDGEPIPATGHDWGEWKTIKEPTYTEMGEEKRECSKGDAEETRSLPVLTRPSDENENIETEKTVEYDSATGEAVIKLLASSKGEKITVNSRTPLDIVLVLDQSGSMEGDLLKKLKTATENFTNAIYADAVENGIDHRIAMVGFAMQNATGGIDKYFNTEILSTGGAPIEYNSLSTSKMNEVYKNALVSVNVDGNLNPVLTLAKNNLDAKGATAADLGLDMACQIFAQNKNDGSRKRIVVFMTDGVPTYSSGYMQSTATNAISKADLLKNAYEADLYSVGVISGNNTNQAKTFLNNVASKDANGKSLYFDSANADKLVEDFKDIATQSTTTVTDFADISLIDTVSNAFTLTAVQEKELRQNAIEKLGITNDDITITRFADGTTEVKLEHIDPVAVPNGNDINYVIDFSFSVTANEKALIEGSYSTNTDNAGVIIGTNDVYENNFVVPSTNIENAEGVVYFTVNGITYHVVRVHKGDSLDAPEFTLEGEYTFSGWDIPEEVVFDGGKLTVDATLTQTEYTVTWNTADGEIVDTYYAGDIIVAPEIGLNSKGEEFLGWNSEVPATMPGENLEFTSIYGKHEHTYNEIVLVKVSCGVTGKIKYTCSCGDSYTETVEALEHNWSTSATSSDGTKTAISYVYCENCGESPDKNLSYTVTGTSGRNQVTYELNLVDANSITVQPNGSIKVSLPIPQNMKYANNIKIYREEADGSLTNLNGTVKNGYITFTTTHFSKYILEAAYECDETGNHTDDNSDNICDICGDNLKVEEPEKPSGNCSHMCHSKNGFVQFFWKIFNFFNRIFNIKAKRFCDCGVAHW